VCGIFGIHSRDVDVANITYFGLFALQHRGQESAGIAVGDGAGVRIHRDMGLVAQVFSPAVMADLKGIVAIGHTRYSTTGSSIVVNAQPLLERTELGDFAFAHNGNLTNTEELRGTLSSALTFEGASDSEVLAKALVEAPGSMLDRITSVASRARGAYSVVLCTQDRLYAFRDPWGVRPLCLGTYGENGYAVASESCALSTIGATYVRELEPGEIICIGPDGLQSTRVVVNEKPALCMFEYIYFARPDSKLNGESIYMARYRMGRQLAREHPVEADVVMAVPDSAIPGAIGFAAEVDLPYIEGLIKNRYIGRTFISPDQRLRNQGVYLKFNPVIENLSGQRIVVVDDSIVRGTTTPRIVQLLRDSGASEVHVRITSPPIKHPCYLGVDMATYDELIAANYSVDEIRQKIGADSLGYLSLDGLVASTGRKRDEMCLGCLTGEYPNVPAGHKSRDFSLVR